MLEIFIQLFALIFNPVLNFIDRMLGDIGTGNQLADYDIKVGFGNVEWFSIDLENLLILIFSLLISIVFIKLVYKVFKFFTKLVNRAFGGRKW